MYTHEEISELLAYGAARGVRMIPCTNAMPRACCDGLADVHRGVFCRQMASSFSVCNFIFDVLYTTDQNQLQRSCTC